MSRTRWWGLRTRIIAWSFVPSVIILLAVALVTFYAYQDVTEDLVTSRNRELARLYASQLAMTLTEYSDLLTSLARTADIYRGTPSVQQAALERARDRLVVFDAGVVVLDTRGRVSAAEPERPEQIGQDWSSHSYYRQMLRIPRPVFSDILDDGPRETAVIVAAVPITGERGEFLGTLAGMFRLGATSVSSFYGGMVKLRVSETGSTFVVDSFGRIVYHSDGDHIGSDVSSVPVVQQVTSGNMGALRTRDFEGQDVVATYAPVPGTSWGLVIQESWGSLISSSQGYTQFLLLLLALGVVVPVLVVVAGVRRITRPIEELIQATGTVANGRFGRSISVNTGDELEELAEHFNAMSAELQRSYADLEQRVADRTGELSTLNAIAAVVSGSLEIEEILRHALDKAMEVTAMEAGAAFRLDAQRNALTLVAQTGLSDRLVQGVSRLPIDASMIERDGRACQPVVIPVATLDDVEIRQLLVEEGFELVIAVPLLAKGKALGVIHLGARSTRPVAAEEVSLLSGIGQQVGMALENAQLYEKAEQSAAAAERSRLARDLHDAVTQTLFSASLIAEVLPRLWERDPDEARKRLQELRQLTRGALAEMRTLLLELRPTALTEANLGDLLRQLAEAVTGRARVPVSVDIDGASVLPPDVQIALYRIAQEALNNVAKHANANQATVSLHCHPGQIELFVSDDGRGFDPKRVPMDHLGVSIMTERAEAIGAQLRMASQPGNGTQISVVWMDSARTEVL